MRIKAVPVREKIVDKGGFIPSIWHNFLDSIVIRLNSGDGVTTTFTTVDGKTVTVQDGIIVGVV
jgi:hypothetical protein